MLKNPREREIYQVFIDNELTAVTKNRMSAIKIRNLAQNNGALAEIRTTDRRHATPKCLELLNILEENE